MLVYRHLKPLTAIFNDDCGFLEYFVCSLLPSWFLYWTQLCEPDCKFFFGNPLHATCLVPFWKRVFLFLLEDTLSKNNVWVYQQLTLPIILIAGMLFASQLTLQLSFSSEMSHHIEIHKLTGFEFSDLWNSFLVFALVLFCFAFLVWAFFFFFLFVGNISVCHKTV